MKNLKYKKILIKNLNLKNYENNIKKNFANL